jgi:hypothetical protein
MVVCALVITACVVMTVLIVGIARDRKPAAQAATVSVTARATATITSPDVQASEGEHR